MSLVYPLPFHYSLLELTTVQRQILQRLAEGYLAAQRVVWNQQTREPKSQQFAIYVQL